MTDTFSWHRSYRNAMLELNASELRAKINIALAELEKRSGELLGAGESTSSIEWQAISDARNNLRVIEKHELTPTGARAGQMDCGDQTPARSEVA